MSKGKSAGKGKSGLLIKAAIILALFLVAALAMIGYEFYKVAYFPNVRLENEKSTFLYIKTGSDFNTVANQLTELGIIENKTTFEWFSELKKYKTNVKAGRFRIKEGMSNNELINLLLSGRQEPVNVTFNNVRSLPELAGKVASRIEADSAAILQKMYGEEFLNPLKLTRWTAMTLFIPNTYEFWWNTSAEQFIERMKKEYLDFWTPERIAKIERTRLSRAEVSILASIVEGESKLKKEQPTIAGVYLNRLRKNMLLQADPTLVFASGDFGIRRVLNEHKKIDSPYNTYMYPGLPPGPISIPAIQAIDAVLNFESHDYLFFCAREDMSGYHSFARTYDQHLQNARRFQTALTKRGIMR